VIEADGNVRLDLLVASRADLSRTQAATLIANGNVTVNGAKEKASYRPVAGDVIVIDEPPVTAREIIGESIPLKIIFEDEYLLIVDKAAGMVVHPAPGNWTGTLVNALMGRGSDLSPGTGPDRAGIVHRLDKETSGLLIVAKTERAHRLLSAAIAARRVTRRYAAMIWGHIEADSLTVEKPLARDPRDRKRMAIVNNGRQARTDFVRLARFGPGDLLRAHLHTGRTHQIRVHLASVGHPIMGDDVYGGGGGRRIVGLAPKRHFLHAAWLQLNHPITGAPMDIRSPLPDDLKASLRIIGEGEAVAQAEDPLAALGFYD
jgi:23S rRNA pseudouridine1911/1915/1917 synthase